MSAFMIGHATMDAVLTFRNRMEHREMDVEALTMEGRKLLELNHVAVEGRYEHNKGIAQYDEWFAANKEVAGDYVFTPRTESDVVLFKALCCFTYQCAEDPAYGTKTYKEWEAFEEKHTKLRDHPDYDEAPWGLCMFGQDEVWTREAMEAKWAEIRSQSF
jgi:hypothetical protein